MDRFSENITDALQPAVGLVLERLCVRAFDADIQSESDLQVDCFYIGGELRLDFTGHSLFVSWVHNPYAARKRNPGLAMEDDCSIDARTSSFFIPTTDLVEWDLTQFEPWDVLVGNPLEAARVLALMHFPNIIELKLGGNQLVLVNSFELEVGGGMDLLIGIRPELIPRYAKELWATGSHRCS